MLTCPNILEFNWEDYWKITTRKNLGMAQNGEFFIIAAWILDEI